MTDSTVELACSLDSQSLEARRTFFRERLLPHALRKFRTEDGLRILFRHDPGVLVEIRALIELERQCCGFLDFELTEDPEQLQLTISGPPGAQAVLDQMASAAQRA